MVLRLFRGSRDQKSRPVTAPSASRFSLAARPRPTLSPAESLAKDAAGNLYLQGDIDFDRETPINDGGYGELFAGSHGSDGKVALKRLRIHGAGEDRQRRLLDTMAEARVWRGLVHPNVLPFLGILFEGREVYLVSPLVENGSLPHYISGHPGADRAILLRQVAEGLAYLHSKGIVHGDVKGTNILVLSGPRSALCDFGLSKVVTSSATTTKGGLGTFRWQSPELMEGGARSFEGDVYAYGMTIYEIISGNIPFHELIQDSAVMIAVIVRDERPSVDVLTTDPYAKFRDVAQRCWATLPKNRPTMTQVSQLLSPPQYREVTKLALPWPLMASVACIAFAPDASQLASGAGDSVRLWNVASGEVEITLHGHTGHVYDVVFSSDGSLVASGSLDGTVRLWEPASGREVATLRGHTETIRSVAFSPDGSRVASGSTDKTIRMWDSISGVAIMTLQGHTSYVLSVEFSSDGSKLASGSADKTVQLWDVVSGAMLITLRGHTNFVRGVAFSPDGLRLASGSDDETVRIWDVSSGKEVTALRRHAKGVNSVAFSPNGRQVASGSDDTTVRVWDATSGAETSTLHGHENSIFSVTFSPDGGLLASGSSDCTVRLWQEEERRTLR